MFTQTGSTMGSQLMGSSTYSSANNWGSTSTGWTMSTYNSYTYVPYNNNAGTYIAPTVDMAAMGGGTQNGGSSQTFLKPTGDYFIDGARFQKMSKNIGIELGFKSGIDGESGAFIHLFSYTAYALGGMDLLRLRNLLISMRKEKKV
ncbi:MAG: hypothetical protein K1X55_16040 [Chitinophagales bacterium]|nr:hypothetical protein [Chitinophagales bacterium]